MMTDKVAGAGDSAAPESARRFRILVADDIAASGLAPLASDDRFELINRPGLSEPDLADALANVDAVLVRSATKITRASLAQASRLSVIGRAGVGVDTIDVDAATERGIAVLTAPSGNTTAAAELTMALLLALVRRVPAADQSMRAGAWDRKSFAGVELYGKKLGLIGAGRIGGEVALRARAFGMQVLAYDPYLSAERALELDMELMKLDDVISRADVLTIHVPLTESTTGLIGDAQIDRMKRGVLLVNAARGGIVDEGALVRALEDGRIGGAALDVYEKEPLPKDHPLRFAKNVVLTPHLGASTAEAQLNVAVEIAEAVRAALLEGDLSRAVNAPSVAGEEMRQVRPLLDLAARLGTLGAALSQPAVDMVEIRYSGTAVSALRPLAAAALAGVLRDVVGSDAVNIVSAPSIAKARGIDVHQVRLEPMRGYAEHLEVRVQAGGRLLQVAGALLAEGHPRIIRIDGFHIDMAPRGTLVILRNRDVPGVIGRVGSILGDAGLNIAEYHQARIVPGGDALAAISLDGRVDDPVMKMLAKLPEVRDVRQVRLNAVAGLR